MLFTVREVLNLQELRSARVLAGEAGLDREVGFVTVMDAPDLGNWLRGKELVITTAFPVKDDPLALPRIIRELNEHGSAGIGIKLRRYLDRISPDALDLADRLEIPLIELPMELAWIDIINPVMSNILHRQAAILERSERIHEEFIRNVLEGGGLGSVARSLAAVTGRPALISAIVPGIQGAACPQDELSADWAELAARVAEDASLLGEARVGVEGESRLHELAIPMGNRVLQVSVLPVQVQKDRLGYVVILPGEGGTSGEDLQALDHAATVTALELMKLRATKEVERRFRSQFIFDLVSGAIDNEQVLVDRAHSLGWQMNQPFGLILLDVDRFERFVAGKPEREIQALKDSLLREANAVTAARFPGAICTDRSDSVIVLIPLGAGRDAQSTRETLTEHARLLQRHLHAHLKHLTVSIGIGRPYPRPLGIPRSYEEARQALALGRELYGTGVIVHFDDLGLYRFLTRGADRSEIAAFVDEHLGALLRHDRDHGGHLVETLRTFLGTNRNVRQSAAALFVHENTLKYRLQRIRQLSGLDLENAEVCFNLQVALKMHQLTDHQLA